MAINDKSRIKVLQKNRKAYFNYEIIDDLECGIALSGTEVKSIRDGRFSFGDSYIAIKGNSLLLMGFTIQQYTHGNIFNHVPAQTRTLLAHKQEVKKLKRKVDEKGFTLVPTSVYLKGNLVKVQVSLAKGKAVRDKKEAIKERDIQRDTRRELRNLNY